MDQLESRIYTVNLKEATRTADKFSRYIFKKCQFSNMLLPKPHREMTMTIFHQRSILKLKNQEGTYLLLDPFILVNIFRILSRDPGLLKW
jgi:hypothetical protein